MPLDAYVADLDTRFDPAAGVPWQFAQTPGYHTRIADGTRAHSTREAMDYALALLQRNGAADVTRACDMIEHITRLQVTDPTAHHYGIWGWFVEEPPQQMNPADWNWADFIGARLAQALARHTSQLRPGTISAARDALRHAALSIFRRNVGPGYTNIAVMGGIVSAAAGELLGLPFLTAYARTRLAAVLELFHRTGGFCEYNSPAYTRVVLEEAERAVLICTDPRVRALAEALRIAAWHTFADHYHPATGQIAGPCSRAYSDRINPALAHYLREQTGAAVPGPSGVAPGNHSVVPPSYSIVPGIPCPPEIAPRFSALPSDPVFVRQRFGSNRYGDTVGTTWFTADACLGSVNRDLSWVQRRALLAYWRHGQHPAAVLRARVLKDGRDFAPYYLRQAQDGPRVLTAFSPALDVGEWHPLFGRTDDARYPAGDLRVRYELQADGATIVPTGPGAFELTAGEYRASVRFGEATFNGRPVSFAHGTSAGIAWAEAVLPVDGTADCRNDRVLLAAGVEIGPRSSPVAQGRPTTQSAGAMTTWLWAGLDVMAPDAPVEFLW